MTVTGIDRDVAARSGLEVRTLSDGAEVAIRSSDLTGTENDEALLSKAVGVAHSERRTPDAQADVVEGNCGSSYFWVEDAGVLDMFVTLGFDLVQPAIAYSASYIVYGPWDYTASNTFSGPLAGSTWDGGAHHNDLPGVGMYEGWGDLTATLWWGGICTSGAPSDGEYIY